MAEIDDYFTQSNPSVKEYRAHIESKTGKKDRRPDIDLTVELGNLLSSEKLFDQQAAQDPEFRKQYLTSTQATDRSYLGELGAGIERGARGLAGTAMGGVALGLDFIGADEKAKALVEKAKEVSEGGMTLPPRCGILVRSKTSEAGSGTHSGRLARPSRPSQSRWVWRLAPVR